MTCILADQRLKSKGSPTPDSICEIGDVLVLLLAEVKLMTKHIIGQAFHMQSCGCSLAGLRVGVHPGEHAEEVSAAIGQQTP